MTDVQNSNRPPIFKYRRQPAPGAKRPGNPALRFAGATLRGLCMTLGGLVLLSIIAGLAFGMHKSAKLPDKMVLYIDLDDGFVEHQNTEFPFGDQKTPIRDAVDAIDIAARDPRVMGIVAQWNGGMGDMVQMEDLRNAVLRFRESNKFSAIYAEDYGESLSAYYLASAFGQIWMQPVGNLAIPGLRAEMPYGRALMDKIGVTPDFFARGEYKNLFESFELNKMSTATQESMTSLIGDLGNTLLGGIAAGRKKTPNDMKAALDLGLMTDAEALRYGFVDKLGYRDELLEGLRQKLVGDKDAEDKLPFFKLADYAKVVRKHEDEAASSAKAPHIALIYAVGEIVPGSEEKSEMRVAYGAGSRIAGDDVSAVIRKAARDKTVKAIVLRVNSPGGSPAASETIRRAVVYAKGRGKPVYVSMGAAAASGGYWISSAADRIYASPLTLTGSIGVAGGKFVLKDLWSKIGVNWDGVGIGQNAGMQSVNTPFTDGQRARMDVMFDNVYNAFVTRVAQGRHMPVEQANKVARGRVWSGNQGKTLNLVDKLGGLDVALTDVAKEQGQPDRFHLNVEVLPKPQTPYEQLADLLKGQVRMGAFFQSHAGLSRLFSPLLDMAEQSDALTYEPLQVR